MSSSIAVADISKVHTLEIENELRVTVGEQPVRLELMSGLAEIYGTEMAVHQVYAFPKHTSIAAYTWHGCSIKITGTPVSVNVVTDPPMILNLILHAVLEQRRRIAESEDTKGPVTLIVGPTDVGKSTLCRLLLNYAARLGKRPLFIDLDVGQNSISIPGTIGVLRVEKPCDIVRGFEDQAVQVYHFGYKSPGHNIILYFLLLKKLGQTVKLGLRQADSNMKSSGIIINSCGWVRGHGYNAITLAAMAFEIDRLCVLAEERLFLQLRRDMPPCVEVLFIPNLGGVVERSRPVRAEIRKARVREYFYGPTELMHPYRFDVNFDDIQLFKVYPREDPEDVDSATVTVNDVNLEPMTLGPYLIDQILALSTAETVTDDIMLTNVFGFICVTHVDINRGIMCVLSPQPGPLPKKILLMGDILLIDRPQYS